jgi:hypothetical protein
LMSVSDRRRRRGGGGREICVVVEELHTRKGDTSGLHSFDVFHSTRNQFLQVNCVHIIYVSFDDLPFSNPASFSNLTIFCCTCFIFHVDFYADWWC